MSPNPSPAVIEAYEARLIIADVLEALSEVDDAWGEHVATHYEGYLAHAAQQPSREQIAEVLCVQWFAPSWERATSGAQGQCLRVADRALALFDEPVS